MNDNIQASYFDMLHHRYTTVLDLPLAQTIEMEAMGTIPGKNIMDFGAGMGRVTFYFLKRGYNVTAIDVSKKSLEDLQHLYQKNKKASWGKLVTLTHIPNTQFDAIVGADILHHIDMPKYVPLFYKALKKNGRIAFSEPNAWHLLWYLYLALQRIPWAIEKGLVKCTYPNLFVQFQQAHFSNIRISGHGLIPTMLFAKYTQLCRFNAQKLGNIPVLRSISFRLILSAQKP